jgi:hypothetical protein
MKRLLILAAALALLPGAARPDDAGMAGATSAAPPPSPAPSEAPPAPPEQPPVPPSAERPTDAQAASSGQWVYTEQYGWVWMPYGEIYTSVPSDGIGEPYEYVYCPSFGWSWVVAPWIWGFGPWPYFGTLGPAYFGWYGHGWWRTPWRWHYRPFPHRPFPAPARAVGAPFRGRFEGREWGAPRFGPRLEGRVPFAAPARFGGHPRVGGGTRFGGPVHFGARGHLGGGGHFGGGGWGGRGGGHWGGRR